MATVGELDRFEDLSVSGTKTAPLRPKKGPSFLAGSSEEATRRGGEKGSGKAEVPRPSRRGRQKGSAKAGEQEKEAVVMAGRHGRQKGLPNAGSQGGGHGMVKKGPLPPAKNMMSEEEIMYIMSWEKRDPLDRKKNRSADFFNQLSDELLEYQQEIKEEFEEKGYVEIPDNFMEDADRMMREAHRKAYIEVFGTEPPAKF